MKAEKMRQDFNRDLEEKEEESAEMKANYLKKMKTLEGQLADEQMDKQRTLKAKRDLERQVVELSGQRTQRDTGTN